MIGATSNLKSQEQFHVSSGHFSLRGKWPDAPGMPCRKSGLTLTGTRHEKSHHLRSHKFVQVTSCNRNSLQQFTPHSPAPAQKNGLCQTANASLVLVPQGWCVVLYDRRRCVHLITNKSRTFLSLLAKETRPVINRPCDGLRANNVPSNSQQQLRNIKQATRSK